MKDKNTDDTSKKHLPLFGVGPVIVYGQFFITGMAIVLSYIFDWSFARIDILNLPLKVIGVLLIIFGFYVLCFCAVFENTQITLIKSTFTSWLISLLYPFIICLITSLVRKASFSCNSKFLYGVKKIMQFL